MDKLGSEFIDDFEKEEKNLFGTSYRIILLFFGLLSAMILIIVVYWLELPEMIYEIYSILVGVPCVFFGASVDKLLKIRERAYYLFLIKRRVYQTELINNKEKGEQ